jgi:peptide deformylase
VLVNPRIVWRSKTTVEKAEGCVNFTTIWGKTRRSNTVKVEAWDRSGNEIALKVTGWPAALLQHEVDHLNGRLFIDRLVDPTAADLVEVHEYDAYRKDKGEWTKKVDVTKRVIFG